MTARRLHGDRGQAAIELPLGFLLILLPIAVVVMVVPQWPERQTVATAAAKEAATLYATAAIGGRGCRSSASSRCAGRPELRVAEPCARAVGVVVSWLHRHRSGDGGDPGRTGAAHRHHRRRVMDGDVVVPGRGLRIAMSRPADARRARGDRGSITLLMLGSTMIVMFVGWLAFTMWNGSNERRQLAAAADQAAQAGATALDPAAFRASGARQLDPSAAEQRALDNLAEQGIDDMLTDYSVNATADQIVVVLEGEVDIGLLRIFDVNSGPIEVRVTAIGIPSEETP